MAIKEAISSLVAQEAAKEDRVLDVTLRPSSLQEFVGQTNLKESLAIFLQAARQRGEALEHVLLAGPPGLGKTSLAHIIARELQKNIRVTSGAALLKVADLAGILTNLEQGDVFFIDEIHRLHRTVEEVLYAAMEDFALDLVVGQGPGAKTLRLDLPPFTLVGATTRVGMLSSPLRDRFGMMYRFDFYSEADTRLILDRSARLLNFSVEDEALAEIARRCRYTPRIANRLLKRVRDFSQVREQAVCTADVVRQALELLKVDEMGLDDIDHKVLRAIVQHYDGGPVGLQTLAAVTAEEQQTLEEVVEPFLMRSGLVKRTSRGRVITRKGRLLVENMAG
jgi:Holliday junction DNA helicase RuvB